MLVGLQSKSAPPLEFEEKWIKAKVIKVRFLNVYRCCVDKSEIKTTQPDSHWPAKKSGDYFSSKPAVYAINKDGIYEAEIIVDMECKNISGKGTLVGRVGPHIFSGPISLSTNKEQKATVKLKTTPDKLQWIHRYISWSVITQDNKTFRAKKSLTELLFVLDDPAKRNFFKPTGIWAEALRFLYQNTRIKRKNKPDLAVKNVTKGCFELDSRKYDRKDGAASFGGAQGVFRLEKYIDPTENFVNCYDQADAVVVFSGALGVPVNGLFMKPFGFLKKTNLIGVAGLCNNPFDAYSLEAELDVNDPDRTDFGNHMFCEFKKKIYDACAGPALGSTDRAGYVTRSIDDEKATTLYSQFNFKPGTVKDIYDVPYTFLTKRGSATIKKVMKVK